MHSQCCAGIKWAARGAMRYPGQALTLWKAHFTDWAAPDFGVK
jgi:hypothetical protein